jgi:hypothetical protein
VSNSINYFHALKTEIEVTKTELENVANTLEKITLLLSGHIDKGNNNVVEFSLLKDRQNQDTNQIKAIDNLLNNPQNGLVLQLNNIKNTQDYSIKSAQEEKEKYNKQLDRKLAALALFISVLSIIVPTIVSLFIAYLQR